MSGIAEKWKSVTKSKPCPICGKRDWCGRSGDVVRCMRNDAPPAGWRIVKKDAEGTVFAISDGSDRCRNIQTRFESALGQITPKLRERLAAALGVHTSSLAAIDCGYVEPKWMFPERNGNDEVIGLLSRDPSGKKKSEWRSKRGLIIPRTLSDEGIVLVVEGPSDVAACLTMGLQAVGRPSAFGGAAHLEEYLKGREVLIVGENDLKEDGSHPGKDAAVRIARRLAKHWGRPVRWALPPDDKKDVRAWLNAKDVDVTANELCHDLGRTLLAALTEAAVEVEVEAGDDDAEEKDRGRRSQATDLVRLCEGIQLFHDGENAYATALIGGRIETMLIRSRQFKRWLAREFFRMERKAPGGQALADAINVIEGNALFEGREIRVHVRLAEHDGHIYLDLANEERNIVQISASGWQIVREAPVRFRRPKGMLPLPVPVKGGSIEELREFINIDRDQDFILLVAWLVGTLRVGRPLSILVLISEQGSGKSTAMRLLRLLVDPNVAPLRTSPREPRDLMIGANNASIIALDNLSVIPDWLSDALCRLSTGGGFSTRTLYENEEETIFEALRPVMLNGIEDMANRSDLLDRAIRVSLPRIPEEKRRPESMLYERFEEARPRILGGLLSAASTALSRLDHVHLDRVPRMADFATWIVAAEPALPWFDGEFMIAYDTIRESAHDLALEASPLSEPVRRFAEARGEWTGSATELLESVNQLVDDATKRARQWPKAAHTLSGKLRRIAPNLLNVGVDVQFPPRERTGQKIIIRQVAQRSVTSVTERHTSPSGAGNGDLRDASDAERDAPVTLVDQVGSPAVTQGDACDASLQPLSNRLDGTDMDEAEERAAILEYEAELPRETAEAMAGVGSRDGAVTLTWRNGTISPHKGGVA